MNRNKWTSFEDESPPNHVDILLMNQGGWRQYVGWLGEKGLSYWSTRGKKKQYKNRFTHWQLASGVCPSGFRIR